MTGYGSDADAAERAARIVADSEKQGTDWLAVSGVAVLLLGLVLVVFWSLYTATPTDCAQIGGQTVTRTTSSTFPTTEVCS